MPVYNAEAYLAQAIEAVLAQSLTDFEFIISDNASTDSSYEICEKYARSDRRIRLVHQTRNMGASANYRTVAQLANASLFKWASANDLVSCDFLDACVCVMDARPECVLCYPATWLFNESTADSIEFKDDLDLQMDDPVDRFFALTARLTLSNVLNGVIRKQYLERAGLMPDFANSDVVILAELSLNGKFVQAPGAKFYRRMNPSSATKLKPQAELRRDYHPTSGLRMYFQAWRLYSAYLATVARANLTLRQRRKALFRVFKMAYWNRRALLSDLTEAATSMLRLGRTNSVSS